MAYSIKVILSVILHISSKIIGLYDGKIQANISKQDLSKRIIFDYI